jgi:para-nitrobenzyl esterase
MNLQCRSRLGPASAGLLLSWLCSLTALVGGESAWAQSTSATLSDPIKTDLGLVSGLVVGKGGKEVRAYRGIPYAAPPVGQLRWKPPQPATPWQGVRVSTQYGPTAAQYYQSPLRKVDAVESQMSEDCLYLNVNTPARSAQDKLPVMVWLHAGGLDAGSGSAEIYNNPALAQHGVVLVTLNHRLGAFGLYVHPDLWAESSHNAAGNYGLLDLIAALQWVRRNIAAFGGDPDRVTIFGDGGGGEKVIWLLASPLAKGLFHRAIIESGMNRNQADNNTRTDTEWEALNVSTKFTAKLGGTNIAELRAKPWQEIVKAMPPPPAVAEVMPVKDTRMHMTIDAWSLTDHPINIFDESLGSDVPVLIGGDEDETGVFEGYAFDWLPALTHRKSNIYVYRFTHVPAGWKKAGVKAPHGLEVRYHFGDLGGKWNAVPKAPSDPGLDKDDQTVAENTMKMWANFAASGDPSVSGLLKWPVFKAHSGEDQYVVIDVKPQVKSGFLTTFTPAEYRK